MTELQFQSKCYLWFHNTFPKERQMLFRVKNELDNHPYKKQLDIKKQLSENKATGVISGPSDFVYVLPGIVVFIELKLEARQSDDQKEFDKKVVAREMLYYLIYSFEEFQNLIVDLQKKYLHGRET